jgi:hypothetical protein
MESRESLDQVQNHVHNRLPPKQACSTSADAPNSVPKKKIRCHDPSPIFSQLPSPGTKIYKDKKQLLVQLKIAVQRARKLIDL